MSTEQEINEAMQENKRRRVESQAKKDLGQRFATAYLKAGSVAPAAAEVGISNETGHKMLTVPAVRETIDEGLSEAAKAAGISKEWVLKKLVEVVERCMQAKPVLDKLGHETGLYTFDSKAVNRSLELLGRHLGVWGDDKQNPATQLGNAVIRVLAQEAQAGREASGDIITTVESSAVIDAPIITDEDAMLDRVPPLEGDNSLAPGSVDATDHPPSTPPVSVSPPASQ